MKMLNLALIVGLAISAPVAFAKLEEECPDGPWTKDTCKGDCLWTDGCGLPTADEQALGLAMATCGTKADATTCGNAKFCVWDANGKTCGVDYDTLAALAKLCGNKDEATCKNLKDCEWAEGCKKFPEEKQCSDIKEYSGSTCGRLPDRCISTQDCGLDPFIFISILSCGFTQTEEDCVKNPSCKWYTKPDNAYPGMEKDKECQAKNIAEVRDAMMKCPGNMNPTSCTAANKMCSWNSDCKNVPSSCGEVNQFNQVIVNEYCPKLKGGSDMAKDKACNTGGKCDMDPTKMQACMGNTDAAKCNLDATGCSWFAPYKACLPNKGMTCDGSQKAECDSNEFCTWKKQCQEPLNECGDVFTGDMASCATLASDGCAAEGDCTPLPNYSCAGITEEKDCKAESECDWFIAGALGNDKPICSGKAIDMARCGLQETKTDCAKYPKCMWRAKCETPEEDICGVKSDEATCTGTNGCMWYEGTIITEAKDAAGNRLVKKETTGCRSCVSSEDVKQNHYMYVNNAMAGKEFPAVCQLGGKVFGELLDISQSFNMIKVTPAPGDICTSGSPSAPFDIPLASNMTCAGGVTGSPISMPTDPPTTASGGGDGLNAGPRATPAAVGLAAIGACLVALFF